MGISSQTIAERSVAFVCLLHDEVGLGLPGRI